MEKKHDYSFCPQCGVKLDGDEMVCSVCGNKLVTAAPVNKPDVVVPPPPPPPQNMNQPVCPSCGAKISGQEIFCNNCGARLTVTEEVKPVTPPPPPPPAPKTETPVTPPPVVETPPVPPAQPVAPPVQNITPEPPVTPPPVQNITPEPPPPVTQQPPVFTPEQPAAKKKGMSAVLLIIIIFLAVVVIGGGVTAFLQYNGTINVPFLSFIPTKNVSNTQPSEKTTYYIMHTFATLSATKKQAVVSDVYIPRTGAEDELGAKNDFKRALQKRFPKDFGSFPQTVLCISFDDLNAAKAKGNDLSKNYLQQGYSVETIKVPH